MPNIARKATLARKVGQVVAISTQVGKLDSISQIKQLAFWSRLSEIEQDQLIRETDHFLFAQQQFGLTAIEIGQRLLNVQKILAPYGAFIEFLNAYFRKDARTGYRYINDYKRLLELFRQPVVEAMIKSGFILEKATRLRPLGRYTAAYHKLLVNKILPPEDTEDEHGALRWVRQLQIEQERLTMHPETLAEVKARAETNGDPIIPAAFHTFNDLLRQDYLSFQTSLRRVPFKQIDDYIETFIGYVLTSRGITGKRFVAQAIPNTFKRRAGRPSHTHNHDMEIV